MPNNPSQIEKARLVVITKIMACTIESNVGIKSEAIDCNYRYYQVACFEILLHYRFFKNPDKYLSRRAFFHQQGQGMLPYIRGKVLIDLDEEI